MTNEENETLAIEIEEEYKAKNCFSKTQIRRVIDAALSAGVGKNYEGKVNVMVAIDYLNEMEQKGSQTTKKWSPFVELVGADQGWDSGTYKLLNIVDYGGSMKRCQNGSNAAGNACNHEIRWVFEVEHVQTGTKYEIGSVCIYRIMGDFPIAQVMIDLLMRIRGAVDKNVKVRKLRAELGDILDQIYEIDPYGWLTYEEHKWRRQIRNGTHLGQMPYGYTKSTVAKTTMVSIKEKWTDERLETLKTHVAQRLQERQKHNPSFSLPVRAGYQPTKDIPALKEDKKMKQNNTNQNSARPQAAPAQNSVTPTTLNQFGLQGTISQFPMKTKVHYLEVVVTEVLPKERKGTVLPLKVEDSAGAKAMMELYGDQVDLDPQVNDVMVVDGGWIKTKRYYSNNKFVGNRVVLTSGSTHYGGTIEKKEQSLSEAAATIEVVQAPAPQPQPISVDESDDGSDNSPSWDGKDVSATPDEEGVKINIKGITMILNEVDAIELFGQLNKAIEKRLDQLDAQGVTELSYEE